MHGLGKYHYSADGDVYDGAWIAGLRSGKGKYSFSNGNYFEGEYQFGERHGVGTFHYVTGEAEVSRYIEGRESGWGAIWSADRQTAWRLDEGSADGTISLDEAESIAHGLGLTVPGVSVVTDSSPAAITSWCCLTRTSRGTVATAICRYHAPKAFDAYIHRIRCTCRSVSNPLSPDPAAWSTPVSDSAEKNAFTQPTSELSNNRARSQISYRERERPVHPRIHLRNCRIRSSDPEEAIS